MDYFLFLTRHTVNCRRQTEIKAKSTVQIPFFEKSAECQILLGNFKNLKSNSVNSEFVKGRPKTSRSFFTFFIFTTAQTFLQDRICLATSKSRKFQSFFIAKKFYCFSDSWDSDILANIAFVIRYQNKFA